MPSEPQPTRQPRRRILDASFRLFYAGGLHGVGIDRIIAESRVAKATLYKHFPTKDDLVIAYLDEVDATWTTQLRAAAEAAGASPRGRLIGAFDALSAVCAAEGYRGCAFINATAEFGPGTRIHDRALAHKDSVREWLTDLATEAGAARPDELARTLSLLIDGALASGSLDARPDAPLAAKAAAELVVAAHLGPARA